jgi:hypothetical protein
MVVTISSSTGNNAEKKLLNVPGCFSGGSVVPWKVSRGTECIPFKVFEYNGPAIRIAGIAMIVPYKSISPILALN